jgi:acyl-CoA synthetase (AMP-forming)/AMP-acid ligase II
MAEAVMAASLTTPRTPPRRMWFDARKLAANDRAVPVPPGPTAVPYVSNGRPIEGLTVRIDPEAERAAGEGYPLGELQIRGTFVFDGYHRDADATAAAFIDGWYRTGDLCSLIDGEIYVFGRIKDIVIHHGANYYAHDLEAAAGMTPGVRPGRCAAVGVYDDEIGSEQIEMIVERDPARPCDDHELRAEVKRAIASRLRVTIFRVHLVEPGWLVKTTSGKMSRKENLIKLQLQAATGRERQREI